MRRLLTVIIIGLLAFMPQAVLAQTDLTLDHVEVDLWPEYDRPAMLVIYQLFLPASTNLPVNLTVQIPSSVGDPTVAVREADGMLYTMTFTRTVKGDTAEINFTTTSLEARVEYYDASLIGKTPHRSYTFTWEENYPVNSLTIQVQQPVDATNLTISPNLGTAIPGEGGLFYYTSMVGSVAAGNTFAVKVDYDKSSSRLSAETINVQPSGPIDASTSGRVSLNTVLPWILGGLGLVLLVGGWWASRRTTKLPGDLQSRRRHVVKPQIPPLATDEAGGALYCHQCGKRAEPGDLFCRACGTRLRQPEE